MKKPYTTEELAAIMGSKPQTPRAALCRDGAYLGIVPVKLPNGRLLWPADQVERVLSGLPARPDAAVSQPSWRGKLRPNHVGAEGDAA